MTHAVYSGTFDPMTLGHLDVVSRAASIFGHVTIAIAQSRSKKPLFDLEERIALAKAQVSDIPNVSVCGFEGLLCDFVRAQGARVVVRGIRGSVDFDYEFQMAGMNANLMPEVQTVFMMPGSRYQFVSSSFVREVFSMGGDVTRYVHPAVLAALQNKRIS